MKRMLFCLSLVLSVFTAANADTGAGGADMWTGTFASLGLYQPHVNTCSSTTEVFIVMGPGTALGFCIEKDERTALTWEEAREDCAEDGKRLAEPPEWKFACKNGTGLNNMTDDSEWVGNSPLLWGDGSTAGWAAGTMGNGQCYHGSLWALATNTPSESSFDFRCVR